MHNVLVVIHVLAAMAWVGGGTLSALLSYRALSTGEGFETIATQELTAGSRLFGPAAVLVLLSGITIVLTTPSWRFSQTFVWLSLTLVLISLAVGGGFYNRTWTRMRALYADSPDDPELVRLRGRMALVQRVDLLILIAVVVLMVTKPGL
jgi:uncharacterized membrane protein